MNYTQKKKNISKAFNRAAKNYDDFSIIQKLTGNILLSKLDAYFNITILDAGCGTGWFSRKWSQLDNIVTALDLSENMLIQAKNLNSAKNYLQADIEKLPIKNNMFDLSWSNLSLQWCILDKAISELYRVTKPGGVIAFSTLADGSLLELKKAFKAVNSYYQTNTFLSIKDIKSCCKQKKILIDDILITFTFSNILEAILSVKKIGANYNNYKKNNLLTRKNFKRLQEYWPYNKNGYLLSYRFAFGIIYL